MIQKYAQGLAPAVFREDPQHDNYMDQIKDDIGKLTPQMSNPIGKSTGRPYEDALSGLDTQYVPPDMSDPLEVAKQTTFTAPNLNPIGTSPANFQPNRPTPEFGLPSQPVQQAKGKIQIPGDPFSYTYVDGIGFKIVSTPPDKTHLVNFIIKPGKPGYDKLEDFVTNTFVQPAIVKALPLPSMPTTNTSKVHVEYPSVSSMVNQGIITPEQADSLELLTPVPAPDEIQQLLRIEPEYARQLSELLNAKDPKQASNKEMDKVFWFGKSAPFGRSNEKYKG